MSLPKKKKKLKWLPKLWIVVSWISFSYCLTESSHWVLEIGGERFLSTTLGNIVGLKHKRLNILNYPSFCLALLEKVKNKGPTSGWAASPPPLHTHTHLLCLVCTYFFGLSLGSCLIVGSILLVAEVDAFSMMQRTLGGSILCCILLLTQGYLITHPWTFCP